MEPRTPQNFNCVTPPIEHSSLKKTNPNRRHLEKPCADAGSRLACEAVSLCRFGNWDAFRGLVAQLVEQCPFNSKSPVLAIFSSFLFPFATIAEPLILLVIINVLTLSHVISQNPKKIFRVISRVQVL
jgi:hypothetical protein